MEGGICLICQKFFNLIYSCQDADDPDLITGFHLADFTPGTRHSACSHTQRRVHAHTHAESQQQKLKGERATQKEGAPFIPQNRRK